ncbi:MAG: hypothetical protein Q9217_005571 [Psora testacea]
MEFISSLQNGFDDYKPSLFELLSENQLSALIPPSLRYLLTVATHRHPRYLLRILNSFDEIYALLMLAVERHYLKTYGGGFSENFYGLKRERVLRIKSGEAPRARAAVPDLMRETLQLKDRDVWNNLAIMVGLPYLKRKLDESYDVHAPQATILGPNYNRENLIQVPTIRQRIMSYYKFFLRKVYPSLNAAYYFSLLAFNLAYLFDNTKYSSPFLWLIGTRIRRLSKADHRAIALATEAPSSPAPRPGARPGQATSLFNPTTFATVAYPRLLSSLKILLPTSIFALKFLEWWHASDFASQLSKKATEGLELPAPVISGLPLKPQLPPVKMKSTTLNEIPATTNTVSLSSAPISAHNVAPKEPNQSTSPPSRRRATPPVSSITNLPIHTVPTPQPSTSALCPICLHPVQTPTSAQTGYVFCYTCIFKWVDGSHERQIAFMEGNSGCGVAWEEEDGLDELDDNEAEEEGEKKSEREELKARADHEKTTASPPSSRSSTVPWLSMEAIEVHPILENPTAPQMATTPGIEHPRAVSSYTVCSGHLLRSYQSPSPTSFMEVPSSTMQYYALLTLAAFANTTPLIEKRQAVTEKISPTGATPPGCTGSFSGSFGIAVQNVTTSANAKRQAPTQIADGQTQIQTMATVSMIADGQIQAGMHTMTMGIANQINDGQIQVQTIMAPVTELADGQPQSPTFFQAAPSQTAPAVSQQTDAQPITPTSAAPATSSAPESSSAPAPSALSSGIDMNMVTCAGGLSLTLEDGVIMDAQGRTGYIASNYQFQFDKPPQAGALYTAGFSACANGTLALGGSSIFYQCLSGTFYNLYDRSWAAQCSPVYINALRQVPC